MKFTILIALAIATEALSISNNDDGLWIAFKNKYGKSFSPEEDKTRKDIFLENKALIDAHNKMYEAGNSSYKMDVNHLADLTKEERKKMLGFIDQNHISISGVRQIFKSSGITAPYNMDYREYGFVTDVKDQGLCASGWAFAAVGALEGQWERYTDHLVSLSAQQLLDCSGMDCDGGSANAALGYIGRNAGINSNEEYPYEAKSGECRWNGNAAATDKGYIKYPSDDESYLTEMLAENGPLAITIDASQDGFAFYSTGIYYDPQCSSTDLNHGALAVGYGTDGAMDFWIVKNSWGKDYGQDGYILMARNKDNNCGVATMASFPFVET